MIKKIIAYCTQLFFISSIAIFVTCQSVYNKKQVYGFSSKSGIFNSSWDFSGAYSDTIKTSLSNLEELYLFGCHLKQLPKDLHKLEKLKKLGLVGNDFDEWEIAGIKNALPNCEITIE